MTRGLHPLQFGLISPLAPVISAVTLRTLGLEDIPCTIINLESNLTHWAPLPPAAACGLLSLSLS
jgi:hypothetical protein